MTAKNPLAPLSLTPQTVRVICHCFQITEHHIQEAIQRGASSVTDIRAITSAGQGCRGCNCRIERMLQGLPPCGLSCHQCGSSSLLCSCATELDALAKAS